MKQPITQDNIVWQLPIASADNNNTGYIHGNAKTHAFVVCSDNLMHVLYVKDTVNTLNILRLSTLKELRKNTYVKSA